MTLRIQHLMPTVRMSYCGLWCLVRSTRHKSNDSQSSKKLQSSLFISNSSDYAPYLQLDIDMDKRMSDPAGLVSNLQARGYSNPNKSVQKCIADYREYKESETEVNRIQKEQATMATEVAQLKKKQTMLKKDKLPADEELDELVDSLSKTGKLLRKELKTQMISHWEKEEKVMLRLLSLPNDLHLDTEESGSKVIEVFGSTDDIAEDLQKNCNKLLKPCIRYSNFGANAYYLTGLAAEVEFALAEQTMAYLRQNKYTQLACPEIFRSLVVEGTGAALEDPENIYWLQLNENDKNSENRVTQMLYVSGVSPLSFLAYLAKMQISEKNLPAKFFTVGRSYCPENDRNLPGIYGATQIIKGEVAVVCRDLEECDLMFSDVKATILQYLTDSSIPTREQGSHRKSYGCESHLEILSVKHTRKRFGYHGNEERRNRNVVFKSTELCKGWQCICVWRLYQQKTDDQTNNGTAFQTCLHGPRAGIEHHKTYGIKIRIWPNRDTLNIRSSGQWIDHKAFVVMLLPVFAAEP